MAGGDRLWKEHGKGSLDAIIANIELVLRDVVENQRSHVSGLPDADRGYRREEGRGFYTVQEGNEFKGELSRTNRSGEVVLELIDGKNATMSFALFFLDKLEECDAIFGCCSASTTPSTLSATLATTAKHGKGLCV